MIKNIPFEWRVAWRYTKSSKAHVNNRFISFISILSIVGISIGVFSLIVVLSVMNGFQSKVRDNMLSVIPHIQVYPMADTTQSGTEIEDTIKMTKGVKDLAPYMSSQSVILDQSGMMGIQVEGINPDRESAVSEIKQKVIDGDLDMLKEGEFNIVLGTELATRLGLQTDNNNFALGKHVTIVAPETNVTIAGLMPRLKQFKLVGVVSSGHAEIDKNYAYIHIGDAQKLFQDGVSGFRVKVDNMEKAPETAALISNQLQSKNLPSMVSDWTQLNPSWFSAVKTEKILMFIILLVITIVAGFNLVSMLVMTVNEKRSDIAIMRTQGASQASIQKIFVLQGAFLGFAGTIAGVIAGIIFAANIGAIVSGVEMLFNVTLLPKGVYFISRMPSRIVPSEVVLVAALSFGLSLLATIYPSRKAAKISPAEALRYD